MSNSSSHNLASQAIQAPQGGSAGNKAADFVIPQSHLTKNGILTMSEAPLQKLQKNQNLVLQVTFSKIFDTEEQKQKKQSAEEGGDAGSKPAAKPKLVIAAKLALSDGASIIKAMIPESYYLKLVGIFPFFLF